MLRALFATLLAVHLCACASDGPSHRQVRRATGAAPAGGPLRCGGEAFEVTAPDGWRAAPRAATAHGMLAAFHPAEQTWEAARVIMAVRCDPGASAVDKLIARDKDRFGRHSSLLVLGEADPIRTAAGHRLQLRTFSGGPDGRNEAVAYLRVSGGTLRLILRTANQHSFEAHLPAFEALLGSLAQAN